MILMEKKYIQYNSSNLKHISISSSHIRIRVSQLGTDCLIFFIYHLLVQCNTVFQDKINILFTMVKIA